MSIVNRVSRASPSAEMAGLLNEDPELFELALGRLEQGGLQDPGFRGWIERSEAHLLSLHAVGSASRVVARLDLQEVRDHKTIWEKIAAHKLQVERALEGVRRVLVIPGLENGFQLTKQKLHSQAGRVAIATFLDENSLDYLAYKEQQKKLANEVTYMLWSPVKEGRELIAARAQGGMITGPMKKIWLEHVEVSFVSTAERLNEVKNRLDIV